MLPVYCVYKFAVLHICFLIISPSMFIFSLVSHTNKGIPCFAGLFCRSKNRKHFFRIYPESEKKSFPETILPLPHPRPEAFLPEAVRPQSHPKTGNVSSGSCPTTARSITGSVSPRSCPTTATHRLHTANEFYRTKKRPATCLQVVGLDHRPDLFIF